MFDLSCDFWLSFVCVFGSCDNIHGMASKMIEIMSHAPPIECWRMVIPVTSVPIIFTYMVFKWIPYTATLYQISSRNGIWIFCFDRHLSRMEIKVVPVCFGWRGRCCWCFNCLTVRTFIARFSYVFFLSLLIKWTFLGNLLEFSSESKCLFHANAQFRQLMIVLFYWHEFIDNIICFFPSKIFLSFVLRMPLLLFFFV